MFQQGTALFEFKDQMDRQEEEHYNHGDKGRIEQNAFP